MNTGKMRHRVDIYTVTTTADGEGGTTPTYTLLATKYAEVKQLSMSESLRSGQVVGESNYRVSMRRGIGENLSRSKQIRWNEKRMNITSIITDEFWLTVNCTEITYEPEVITFDDQSVTFDSELITFDNG